MSEFIEKRRELSIHEYEFMKHLKLFTADEIREIKNKRFQHEHRIERRAKELTDYINYIVFETSLLELLKVRRKKLRVRDGLHSLEHSIQNRIKMLYKRAMDRFSGEYRLWVHYLKHCKQNNCKIEASRALDKMLNFHGDKPAAWMSAAKWEYTQMENLERTKHFMFRGLQRHPDSREMFVCFLDLMLKEADKVAAQIEERGDLEKSNPELCKALECVQLINEHYKNREQDLDFFIELIACLKQVKAGRSFGKNVLEEMKRTFAGKELMWHTLAQLAYEDSYLVERTCEKLDSTFEECLKRCIQMYETAVESLPTIQMWTYYIDAMLQINEDMSSYPKLRRKALAEAFKNAYSRNFLDEQKFIEYLKLLTHSDKPRESFIAEVFQKALDTYPSSGELWELRLKYAVWNETSADEFDVLFKQAAGMCAAQNTLPLWIVRCQYFETQPLLSQKLQKVFHEATQQSAPEISQHFQPLFLNYLMVTKNIEDARNGYRQMQRNCISCLELHRKMSELELLQVQPDLDQLRLVHENITQYFGGTSPDVWIDYINFEREHGSPKKMQLLFERAKSRLDSELIASFITQYELLKNPLI
ncbi:U3 small nucleolar RNA-associated protein 6 homolog [Wyeomyia smithii]|uniref:U3 small nucleolar RNA-associated protein 6 homolog n=1 Tax=Wyeomyia smithii TaxID=174621 RepID=UPI002467C269|nr:U3 small nucleolar RNA-associated protein 6 homolog [Wyeomyia smithii]